MYNVIVFSLRFLYNTIQCECIIDSIGPSVCMLFTGTIGVLYMIIRTVQIDELQSLVQSYCFQTMRVNFNV